MSDNKIVKVEIINKKELKKGFRVLFGSHIVTVLVVSIDSCTFENDDIGKLTMPLYGTYYKLVEKEQQSKVRKLK